MNDEGPNDRDRQREGDGLTGLHLWEIQPVRDVLLLLGVLGVVYLGYLLSPLTVPILLALLFAYLFEPLVRRMTRLSWMSRQGAAVAIIVGALVLVVVPVGIGVTYGIVSAASTVENVARQAVAVQRVVESEAPEEKIEELRGVWREIADRILEVIERRREMQAAAQVGPPFLADESEQGAPDAQVEGGDEEASYYEELREDLMQRKDVSMVERLALGAILYAVDWVLDNRNRIQGWALQSGVSVAGATLRGLRSLGFLAFGAFLTAFFFFFFCVGFGKVVAFTEKFIPKKHHERTIYLVKRMDGVVSGFVRGRLTICAIQCVIFSIGYLIVGVPGAVLVGVLVGVLALVPYLAMIGIPVTIILMAIDPGEGMRGTWWWIVLAPTAVYFITQALDDYVFTPLIQGKATGLDTPTVLFCALAGGLLGGIYGLLLAIPVGACIKILLEELVWPRILAWAKGERADPLPISGSTEE